MMRRIERTIDCVELLERWDEVLRAVSKKGASFVVTWDGHPCGWLQPVDRASSMEFTRRRQLLEFVRRRR
jgi:hypothetical protein